MSSPVVKVNGKQISVEIADTVEERSRGLMFRESLCEACGMLFVFEEEGKHSFWMKNTLIPLDMIFIDAEGVVVDIIQAEPCVADPCLVYLPDEQAQYVLEIMHGRSMVYEIERGTILHLPVA